MGNASSSVQDPGQQCIVSMFPVQMHQIPSQQEPLFGECEEAMLTVSVSFGSSALFKWKGKSYSETEAHLCCLGHDGQCQDKFLHCTSPSLEQDRYVPLDQTTCSLLFLSEGGSGMLFANVCAGFISSCHGDSGKWRFFFFGFSLVPCACGRCWRG